MTQNLNDVIFVVKGTSQSVKMLFKQKWQIINYFYSQHTAV